MSGLTARFTISSLKILDTIFQKIYAKLQKRFYINVLITEFLKPTEDLYEIDGNLFYYYPPLVEIRDLSQYRNLIAVTSRTNYHEDIIGIYYEPNVSQKYIRSTASC